MTLNKHKKVSAKFYISNINDRSLYDTRMAIRVAKYLTIIY